MTDTFPSPMVPAASRAEVLVGYLDYFRQRVVEFHLLQEYARHLGHLDIVAELAHGSVGE